MFRIGAYSAAAMIAAASAVCPSAFAYDGARVGYGQGAEVDAENRPLGAVSFTERYDDLDAFALSKDKSRVVITFDQGYENGYTARILDTLKEKNVRAIFFLTGDYAKSQPELIKRMIDEGHVLGNHGMKHASLPTLSEEAAKEEIGSLHEFVRNNYGYNMQYFRPPCGEYSEKALATVKDCGYKTVFWSFAYVDWKTDAQPEPSAALKKLTDSAHGGEILLLHSVSSTNAEILGDLIDALRAKGLEV